MPINDPGNAATAPTNGRARPVLDDDRRRRLVALTVALATALVLLPAVVTVTVTGEWRWIAGGAGAWLSLIIAGSSIASYRYGSRL